MTIALEPMNPKDWPVVRAIYQEGIETGHATFESITPEWAAWDKDHMPDCRLIAKDSESNAILGWAALIPVSGRCVYAGVAEVSVYIAATARGRGIGKMLLNALIESSEKAGLWTLQAGIFPENVASLALHKTCGFRKIGYQEHIGKMDDGTWRNVIRFERRSSTVGID